MTAGSSTSSPRLERQRGEEMRTPDEVTAMLRLRALGWGLKRIAAEFGCSRNTVRRYVEQEGWAGYRTPRRVRLLGGLENWLEERFLRHRGNADVVRQDLEREHGVRVSLRTVERAVAHLRQRLRAEARATVRFETPPGRQLQVDFGELRVTVGGEGARLHLFVATLGHSRRCYVRAFRHERQSAWFDGIEGAFGHFGGIPQEVLFDNARALVDHHDAATREVRFNERLRAFARYWGFRPRACAPYRARTKGKDERGVGYVKRNAIAGHDFAGWAALEAHLAWWMREVADLRAHGTTGEPPIERFRREEAGALRPLDGRPPFQQIRDLIRRVGSDCCVEVDTNAYSVPWRLIGETVRAVVAGGRVSIHHGGLEVAVHSEAAGRRQRLVEPGHFAGVSTVRPAAPAAPSPEAPPVADLLRPLRDYEQLVGGGW
ncbi:MAG TPA: IS21 family transposase [Methylomirabilota bacterium]|nr:IS21 family transposase [Methylomirabilota bacterium]HXV22347.1 IS21 family transposase [Desulfuromonadales bacterium]